MGKKQTQHDDLVQLQNELGSLMKRIPMWVWWVGVLIFGAFIFQYTFTAMTTYTYEGLTFTRIAEGDLTLHHHAYFIDPTTRYHLYLRQDPRENEIPVTGDLLFTSRRIYFSIDVEGLASCEDSTLGVGTLTAFLNNNKLKVKPSTPDPKKAYELNLTQADCDSHPEDTVILLRNSSESSVYKEHTKCFILNVHNCSVMPVIEKFMVETVADRRALGADSLRP